MCADNMNYTINALQKKLAKETASQKRLTLLLDLGNRFGAIDASKALIYGREALELAAVLTDEASKIAALQIIGESQNTRGEYRLAIATLDSAAHLCDEVGDEIQKSEILLRLSYSYRAFDEFHKILETLDEALEIQKRHQLTSRAAESLRLKGSVHHIISN